MDAGGTQRFTANLTAGLVERGVDVEVATLSRSDSPDFFDLPASVGRHRLRFDSPHDGSLRGKVRRDMASIGSLRSLIRTVSPDVIVSLGWSSNVITLATTRGTRVPVVVSERVDPRDNPLRRGAWAVGQRLFYPFATRLVTQTQEVQHLMRRWVRHGRIVTIPNPVPSHLFATRLEPSAYPHIVSVCRLTPQKGVDTLLEALSLVVKDRPEVRLSLVGDGVDRVSLESLVENLGLTGNVSFHGMLDDPVEVAKTAWIGCLASRNEGFPNALVELMAMGLPVVSTDCRSGPSEILGGGGGLLVPVDSADGLASALSALVSDEPTRRRLGEDAKRRARDFESDRVIDAWIALLRSVASA